jgi:hypothetical protein
MTHLALVEMEICMDRLSRASRRLAAVAESAARHGDSVCLSHLPDLTIFLGVVEGRRAEVVDLCRRRGVETLDKGDQWRALAYLSFQILIEAPTERIEHLEALVERFVEMFDKWPNDEPPTRWAVHWGIEALRARGVSDCAEHLTDAYERRTETLLAGLDPGESLWDPSTLVARQ